LNPRVQLLRNILEPFISLRTRAITLSADRFTDGRAPNLSRSGPTIIRFFDERYGHENVARIVGERLHEIRDERMWITAASEP
jgi:hypothetical protein